MCRMFASAVSIFFTISIIEVIVHGYLLMDVYKQTELLWRPIGEIKGWVLLIVLMILSLGFTCLYKYFVACKCPLRGTKFGLLLGFVFASCLSFGSYGFMPIPFGLALAWFFSAWIEFTFAGLIAGLLIKDEACC